MTGTTPQRRPRKERKENADRRRRQLLDATRRSIAANGLQRTTFDTVADDFDELIKPSLHSAECCKVSVNNVIACAC